MPHYIVKEKSTGKYMFANQYQDITGGFYFVEAFIPMKDDEEFPESTPFPKFDTFDEAMEYANEQKIIITRIR